MTNENIIARLKEIHAEWIRQSKPGGRRFPRSDDEERVFSDCADQIEEIIKEIEEK